jgi:hypothetical protein
MSKRQGYTVYLDNAKLDLLVISQRRVALRRLYSRFNAEYCSVYAKPMLNDTLRIQRVNAERDPCDLSQKLPHSTVLG